MNRKHLNRLKRIKDEWGRRLEHLHRGTPLPTGIVSTNLTYGNAVLGYVAARAKARYVAGWGPKPTSDN